MNLLFIGDVVGAPGRRALASHLPGLRDSLNLDLVVANCENAADGVGVTAEIARELCGRGMDVLTNGNHARVKKEALGYVQFESRLLRPRIFHRARPVAAGTWRGPAGVASAY